MKENKCPGFALRLMQNVENFCILHLALASPPAPAPQNVEILHFYI